MNYQRFFDISFIRDSFHRNTLQNAIEGVNVACIIHELDAWLYVAQGYILNDIKRLLRCTDVIPLTIFKNMEGDAHTEQSLYQTVSDLCSIANDYESWKSFYNQKISVLEESSNFWNMWKTTVLSEHYKIIHNKTMLGGLLSDFFTLKYQRNDVPSDLENEIMNLLGNTIEEKIETLEQIIKNTDNTFIVSFYNNLLIQKESEVNEMGQYLNSIKDALRILQCAIESKNPIAIHAALNPGWTSVEFMSSSEYKNAVELLKTL